MEETVVFDQLKTLFLETIRQHKVDFAQASGFDPEWPLWYANYLLPDLGKILNASFTKSELIYLLVLVEKERSLEAPGAEWSTYYAHFFEDRYS